jgi:23S rRNA (cytidine1920-2'-O)/16S rRNA (cytidine1409-2'-O)-methyltransferase
VIERTNALHWSPETKYDLVASDLGWTRQALALPVMAKLLVPGGNALSLVKPQYEAPKDWLKHGVLGAERLPSVMESVRSACPVGLVIVAEVTSPLAGSGGNTECWLHLRLSTTAG